MNTKGATDLSTNERKKETSLREAIMNSLKKKFECEGLEAARKWFDNRCADFSGEEDWSTIYNEVYNFIFESKKLLDEEERQRQLDMSIPNELSIGGDIRQQVILLGSTPNVSYYSTKSKII